MQNMMGNMMSWNAWGPGMMLLMVVFWIAILALIIVAIIYLVRNLQGKNRERTMSKETPLDILKKRYASGEIDKKEFEEKKETLHE